jgi:alpha-L-rhamnosidase
MERGVSRRGFVAAGALGAAAAAGGPAVAQGAAQGASTRVVGLAVDGVERPLGLQSAKPQLSWRIESDARDVRQGAYRIRVASSPARLAAGEADVWDSGKVVSDQSFGVAYGGPALQSRARLHWSVQIWAQNGAPSAPSQASWWEMGLLAPADWSAAWIAATTPELEADRAAGSHWIWGETGADAAPRQFRFRFDLPAAPLDARLTLMVQSEMTGLWLNGEAMALDPVGQSGSAQAFDLALKPGVNVVALEALAKPANDKDHPIGRVGGVLRMRLADGQVRRLTPSADWKTALGAPQGWQAPGFDDSGWKPAQDVSAPTGKVPWPAEPAIQMRRSFSLSGPVRAARLYVTALGAYEPRLNGRKVGDALLAPESADFNRHALYRVYDVRDALAPGENVLGLIVGDGWYAGAQVIIGRYGYGPPPRRARAQLEIEYADGARQIVGTDGDWRLAASPIRSSENYNGEVYDARRETPGWDGAGFDAAGWEAALPAPTDLPIDAEISPPIRATQTLTPKALASPAPGVQVFDFGQNFAGWCRLRVKGAAGTVVELRFAEILKPSGEIDQSNLRSARASDIYILKGDPAGETFEPHFTYHGFRYVEVRGYPGTPAADAVEGVVIHSDLPVTGRLVVDNPLIDHIWRNTVWSQRSNFMGVPTDCPQRDERMGWMGDAEIFWDAAAFNMDVDAFTRRFMGEVRASQRADGAFTDVSPLPTPLAAGSPGWADAGVILPWTAWRRYGDTAVIDENWSAMDRYLGEILAANPDHLWSHKRGIDFGDWLSLDGKTPGDATTPKDLIGTAFWAHTSSLMAEMAQATGRSDDAARYGALHTAIAAAFSAAYVRPDGQVGNDSQTSSILALRFGLAPPALRAAIGERLAANIRARGTLLTTGFLGTPFSLDVLADTGHVDLAYSLLLRTDYPSWGYMIRKGATTMWERWNGDVGDVSMNSYNHYALGAVSGFLFRRIAGIAPAEPGFRRILVEPALDPRVRAGGADYHSVLGLISTRWRQEADGVALDLTVPPNAVAEVRLPAASASAVREGGRPISRLAGVRVLPSREGLTAFEVGSGSYNFRVVG